MIKEYNIRISSAGVKCNVNLADSYHFGDRWSDFFLT